MRSLSESSRLSGLLRSRREEIEEGLRNRIYTISDPVEVGDLDYVTGLNEAMTAALSYALIAIECDDLEAPELPSVLLTQARKAARCGVGLDVVLRRYFAGYTFLSNCLLEEEAATVPLRQALRTQAGILDRIVVGVTGAHAEETMRPRTADRRRAEQVRRLLDGDLVNAAEIEYEMDGWHLGIVATGPRSLAKVREFATTLDRRLLVVSLGGKTLWAWLGGRRPLEEEAISSLVGSADESAITLGVGHTGHGIRGWRLTHRQAKAAFHIAQRGSGKGMRYADVALVASIWGDHVLASSLTQLYLAPLRQERDGGATLRETLGAYFSTGRNVSSAAAELRLSRQTVNTRLQTIEDRIGRSLKSCGAELEAALWLWELRHPVTVTS